MHKKNIDFVDKFAITSAYFLVISLLIIFLFKKLFLPLLEEFTIVPFIVLVCVYILNIFLYRYARRNLDFDKKQQEKYHRLFFLSMRYKYMFSKSFEIFFQQTMVVLLTLLLMKAGLSIYFVISFFVLIFTVGHIPIVKLKIGKFSAFYIGASFLAGIAFPLLIIFLNYGFVYSYALHWLFYGVTGFTFRLIFHKHTQHKKEFE
jgi:hypothetical protein